MHLQARTVAIGHRELDRLRKFISMSGRPGIRIPYRELRARRTNQLISAWPPGRLLLPGASVVSIVTGTPPAPAITSATLAAGYEQWQRVWRPGVKRARRPGVKP